MYNVSESVWASYVFTTILGAGPEFAAAGLYNKGDICQTDVMHWFHTPPAECPRDTLCAGTAETPSKVTILAHHSKKQRQNYTQGMGPVQQVYTQLKKHSTQMLSTSKDRLQHTTPKLSCYRTSTPEFHPASNCSMNDKSMLGGIGTDQQNQWLHLVLVGSRRGLSKQMQQASSVHTALGSTVVFTLPTESGISCNKPAGKHLCADKAFTSDTVIW